MYLKLHSLLLYCNFVDGENNINLNRFIKYKTNQRTRQGTHKVIVAKTRLSQNDENFSIRTAILYNIFCKTTDLRSKKKEMTTNTHNSLGNDLRGTNPVLESLLLKYKL